MKTAFFTICLALVVGAASAFPAQAATDKAGVASAAQAQAKSLRATDEAEQKRALILRYYEVVPPRALIDASIEAIANVRYGDDSADRDEFISRLQLAVDYDALEAKSTEYMIDLFTLPELKAMVEYYTSDIGQAIEAKLSAHRQKMAPDLKVMLDRAILEYATTPSPAESAATTP